MKRISTFDDWIDYFRQWQKDIGYDATLLGNYQFETKLGELHTPEVEFGDFRGQARWNRVGEIPNQAIRDAEGRILSHVYRSYRFDPDSTGRQNPDYDRAKIL